MLNSKSGSFAFTFTVLYVAASLLGLPYEFWALGLFVAIGAAALWLLAAARSSAGPR